MAFFGVVAQNDEQKAALHFLNDKRKPFTFITGPAGTGKNIITQAVGLENVIESKNYDKLVYTRLQVQLGQHLGYLTGDLDGKTVPFMLPFIDNLEKMDKSEGKLVKEALLADVESKKKKVFFDSVQTLRGRSISDTYFILDEAQNTDTHTMEAIASRIDNGSKFVFIGNFAQIDEHKLRKPEKNGFYQLLKGMYELDKNKRFFDHIHLTEVHRDPVVNLVADIFKADNQVEQTFADLENRGTLEALQKIVG